MQKFFKRQHGFTLIEALIQLFIMLLMTQLLLTHQFAMTTFQKTFYSDDVYWEMFIDDMQRYIQASDEPFRVYNNAYIERSRPDVETNSGVIAKERFDFVQSGTYIRRVLNGGNEPLLYNVERMYVHLSANTLTIRVTFLDGRIKERDFYVPATT